MSVFWSLLAAQPTNGWDALVMLGVIALFPVLILIVIWGERR